MKKTTINDAIPNKEENTITDTINTLKRKFYDSGWRPAAGWVVVTALALLFPIKALAQIIIWVWQAVLILTTHEIVVNGVVTIVNPSNMVVPNFPDIGLADIIGLLVVLITGSITRTIEKKQDTVNKH